MVFWSHYSDEKHTPLYPFGYGLSYSNFEYSNLVLNRKSFSENGNIVASVTLKNSSQVAGKEVVQWYIRDLVGSYARPVKELKGFEMVELRPFESKVINFVIDEKAVEFFTANSKWEVEPGDFKVFVGGSSDSILELDFQYVK